MISVDAVDFDKMDGLVPVVVQDSISAQVLMVGFMNREALQKTLELNKVTFFSRTKKRLWTKGEESGNFLLVEAMSIDCDNDSILILAKPLGPTCHTGSKSCFGSETIASMSFLSYLESVIEERKIQGDESSYTKKLFSQGISRIAQKVGEEGLEVALSAVQVEQEDAFIGECGDLLFHLMILLNFKQYDLNTVVKTLKNRHVSKK